MTNGLGRWLVMAWGIPLVAQADPWGGVEGRWMAWGAGARAIGVGRAYTALAADASASYWNPAGLASVDRPQLMALRAQLWEGVTYDYATFAFPTLRYGTFGLSGTMLNAGGGEGRDAENHVVGGGFTATKSAWTLSYGLLAVPGVEVGASVTHLGRWVAGVGSGFVTGDLGGRVTVLPGVVAGLSLKHLVTTTWGVTQDTLPVDTRAGLAATLFEGVTVAAEWEAAGRVSVGVEAMPLAPLRLRLGTGGWESTAGMGVTFGEIGVDYSAALHRELGLAHRIALAVTWGDSAAATRWTKAREAFDRAWAAYRDGRLPEARQAIQDTLGFDPTHPGAQYLGEKLERLTK